MRDENAEFEKLRFSLAWLLWLVTCAAIACWAVTLPAMFNERLVAVALGPQGSYDHIEHFVPSYWPAEVTARLLLVTMLAASPLSWKWRRGGANFAKSI